MSKLIELSELDTIDIYNLVNTKIENDHILCRNYKTTQNSTLMNFIEDNIAKIPKVKEPTSSKSTMTDKQAYDSVLSMITNIADK